MKITELFILLLRVVGWLLNCFYNLLQFFIHFGKKLTEKIVVVPVLGWLLSYVYSLPIIWTHKVAEYFTDSGLPAKVHVLLSGNTLDVHKTFMKQLNVKMNECSVESCSVVLLFCPVTSRMGTDIEEAMKKAPDNKPVILVIMNHHHDPNLVLSPPVQLPKDNIEEVVQCIFHESQGLLQCDTNNKAIKEVSSALGKYK